MHKFGFVEIIARSEGPSKKFRGPAAFKGQLFLDTTHGEYYRAKDKGFDVEWERIFLATSPIGEVSPEAIVDAVNAYLAENPVEPIDLSDGLIIETDEYKGQYEASEASVREYLYPEGLEGPKVEASHFEISPSGVQFTEVADETINQTYERYRIRKSYTRYNLGGNELTIERPDEMDDPTSDSHILQFPFESGVLATRNWVTDNVIGGQVIEGLLDVEEEPPHPGIWLRRKLA